MKINMNPNQRRKEVMKNLKKDVQAVARELKALTKKTQAMEKKLAKLEKTQTAKKGTPRAKTTRKAPAKKPGEKKSTALTATAQVVNIIEKAKNGVDAPTLIKKTGLEDKQIRNILFRASKQGKIKRTGRGIYVVA
jgi:Skp family chaperone for outer membrane proteins